MVGFILIMAAYSCFSQEVQINGIHGTSGNESFKVSNGYGVAYNQFLRNNRRLQIGANVIYGHNKFVHNLPYQYNIINTNDVLYKVHLCYSFRLIGNPKSSLYLSPKVSLNYYSYHETINCYNDIMTGGFDDLDKSIYNVPGLGLILEYEINHFFIEELSFIIEQHSCL